MRASVVIILVACVVGVCALLLSALVVVLYAQKPFPACDKLMGPYVQTRTVMRCVDGQWVMHCASLTDPASRALCEQWNEDYKRSLDVPVYSGKTNFACYDPASVKLQQCKGTCEFGECVPPPPPAPPTPTTNDDDPNNKPSSGKQWIKTFLIVLIVCVVLSLVVCVVVAGVRMNASRGVVLSNIEHRIKELEGELESHWKNPTVTREGALIVTENESEKHARVFKRMPKINETQLSHDFCECLQAFALHMNIIIRSNIPIPCFFDVVMQKFKVSTDDANAVFGFAFHDVLAFFTNIRGNSKFERILVAELALYRLLYSATMDKDWRQVESSIQTMAADQELEQLMMIVHREISGISAYKPFLNNSYVLALSNISRLASSHNIECRVGRSIWSYTRAAKQTLWSLFG